MRYYHAAVSSGRLTQALEPMRLLLLSFGAGLATELLFTWMAVGTGWGPCGPGTFLGLIGLVAHLFPGIILAAGAYEAFGASNAVTYSVAGISQLCFWVLLFWFFFRARARNYAHGL